MYDCDNLQSNGYARILLGQFVALHLDRGENVLTIKIFGPTCKQARCLCDRRKLFCMFLVIY